MLKLEVKNIDGLTEIPLTQGTLLLIKISVNGFEYSLREGQNGSLEVFADRAIVFTPETSNHFSLLPRD
jgi:hypothetical protein